MKVSLPARARALFLSLLIPGIALAAFAPTAQALPTITVADAQVVEGNNGTKQMVFNASLSSPSATDVWVSWQTQSGAAMPGTDYVDVWDGRLTFPAGSTVGTISITVSGDSMAEGDEGFRILLNSPNGATLASEVDPVGIIVNDDVLPSISIADATIAEDASSVMVHASLLQPVNYDVSFDVVYTNGTAVAGSDYVVPSSTHIVIPAGSVEGNAGAYITNDSAVEGNETFTVSIANANGATVADGSALVTIADDDGSSAPKLSIWDNYSSVTEGDTGSKAMNFEVRLSQAAATDVYFDAFTLSGSAVAGLDYTATSAVAQKIPAGQISTYFSVPILGDTDVESQEMLHANLANVTGARVGDAQAYGIINDNDLAGTGSLNVGDVRITEGQSGTKTATFTVTLSAASNSTVSFDIGTSNNTALGGEDFEPIYLVNQVIAPGQTSKSFSVTIVGDTAIEADESFYVGIFNARGATTVDETGVVTILNDDSNGTPMITVDDASVTEGNSGTRNMVFTVRLAAATTHLVSYTIATGNATADGTGGTSTPFDYTPTTLNLSIPAGSTTGSFSVPVKGDTAAEASEYFNVTISNIVGAYWAGSWQARGVIIDDDHAPTIWVEDVYANEGDGTKTLWFTVNLTNNATSPVSFNLASSNGTASAGSDFVAVNLANQTIPVGETSKVFAITINGDSDVEANETFTLNLGNVSGATTGTGSATVTLANDDEAPQLPWLSVNDVVLSEGNSGTKAATFTVTLNRPLTSAVSFDAHTSAGSASTGDDFVGMNLTGLTIPAGQTSTTFDVMVNGDTTPEADEWFRVDINNFVGTSATDTTGIATITNDDFVANPTLSVNDQFRLEGNTGTGYVVTTVSLSGPADHAVTFDLATADGTAVAPGDYTAVSTTGTIPANATSAQFNIPIIADTDIEADPETFYVNVTNVSGATIADGQGSVWIGNDDQPPTPLLSVADVSVTEGDSGTKSMTFTVSLSVASSNPVGFDIRTLDDSAAAPADFAAQTLAGQTIPAGETSKSFTVLVNGDTTFESDEAFGVYIDNVSGAVLVDGYAVGSILNDDGAPPMLLSVGDVSITEGDSGENLATITFSLDAPATSTVRFDAQSASGTAVSGSDFVALSMLGATLVPGQTSITQTVQILGDTTLEPNEVFYIDLSNIEGATAADSQAAITIINDDSASSGPTLAVDDVSVAEGNSGTKLMTFTITLSQAQTSSVFVDVTTGNGTAASPADFVARSASSMRIAAGATTKSFAVTINGDTAFEQDESFNVQLSNAVGAAIADNLGIGTITNDDASSTPSLSIADASISEGNSGTKQLEFTVSMSAASAGQVSFEIATASGTATAGSDFMATAYTLVLAPGETSKVVSIAINGDTTVEPNETFGVSLSNVGGVATIADGSATGTIIDDDAVAMPSLSIADISIAEGNTGTKTATFTVSLSAPAPSPVSFDIASANGTATAGTDFVTLALSGQQIATGQSSATVSVTINGDTTVESDETFTVNVSNVSGATMADGSAAGTITNDDAAGGPTLSIGDVTITEGNSGTSLATFTVTLSAVQTGPVNFDLATADGTATAGSDYVAKSNPGMRIAAGNTSKAFAVTINGDAAQEASETFFVNLTNPIGATIVDGQAVGTISNDDSAATPTLSIGDASVTEGNSGTKVLNFTVSLSPAAAGTVSYDIATSNGTATSGSDYVAASLTGETISAGATSKTFAVTINGDTTTEANETFNVTLSGVSGATLGDGSAVGTITNDDGTGGTPTLTIADVSIAEGNSLSKQMTFTVKLSAAATGPVTYNIATANGTALAPGDYTAKSLTGQSIAAGATSKTFTVAIKGDRVVEPNETFKVNVTGVTGATLGDGQATGTITNDDAAAVRIARFDAGDLVDDVDDGNREPRVTTNEYASLLADGANSLCRRASNATVIAVDGVENRQVLADLAAAANAVCANKPAYDVVMADSDSRGFLIAMPAKGQAAVTVLGKPAASAASTAASFQVPGHSDAVTVVLASSGSDKELTRQLQLRAKAQPTEALMLLGAKAMTGLVDMTARTQTKPGVALPDERILVNAVLLERYRQPGIELTPLPAREPPAQVLELQ